jgi:dipeptidase E
MTNRDGVKRLLLISNSTVHGGGYLDHAEQDILDLVGCGSRVAFVPYALHDRRGYAAKAEARFRDMGFSLMSVHDVSNVSRAVDEADAIFVGGGNTFRLLKELYDHDLLGPIRRRIATGVPWR